MSVAQPDQGGLKGFCHKTARSVGEGSTEQELDRATDSAGLRAHNILPRLIGQINLNLLSKPPDSSNYHLNPW